MSVHTYPNSTYRIECSAGNITDTVPVVLTMHNDNVTTTEITVWDEGTDYVFPAAAVVMTVSSDDANDTNTGPGSGAQTVLIQGLDTNYLEISETILMNGTSAVTTDNSYLRINKMIVLATGSSHWNEGNIYIGVGALTAGKPATVYNLMHGLDSISHVGVYTVPANKRFFPNDLFATSESSKSVTLKVTAHNPTTRTRIVTSEWILVGDFDLAPDGYVVVLEKFDIELRAKVKANTTPVAITIYGSLRDAP